MKYEKEKKIVTVTKKGRAVLDEHLPDDVKSRYHVLGKVSETLFVCCRCYFLAVSMMDHSSL